MAEPLVLTLDASTSDVPRARHLAREAAAGTGVPPDEVELIVGELAANAVLHAVGPIELTVSPGAGIVRVEVADHGDLPPLASTPTPDAMTGRGLHVVDALAARWGYDLRGGGGKVVWAELRAPPVRSEDPDVPRGAATPVPAARAPGEVTVVLRSVPTALVAAARLHFDDVARELALARATGRSLPVPAPVAELVEAVAASFAEPRAHLRRLALEATERGQAEMDITLRLPPSAADAADRFLAAIDEIERDERGSRLLTTAAPASHTVFRRWALSAIVRQLRAATAGEDPAPDPPLAAALVEVLDDVAKVRDAWQRLQALETVTAQLARASTVEESAAAVVDNCTRLLGAHTARVYLLRDGGVLESVATVAPEPALAAKYEEYSLHDDLPGSIVARTGQPLLLHSTAEIEARFPALRGVYDSDCSLHVAPLLAGDRPVGVLSLTYLAGSSVDQPTQVSYVAALSASLVQALERARAQHRAEESAERLSFLADASLALSASLDPAATLDAVTRIMVPRLADWCVIQLAQGDRLATVALHHHDPAWRAWAQELADRWPTRLDGPGGAARVATTGLSEIVEDIPEAAIAAAARDAEHLEALRTLRPTSGIIVPLVGRGGTLGVVTLLYSDSARRYTRADLPFAEDVARRAGLALEASQLVDEQAGRLATVRAVAEAAQRAILAPVPARAGAVLLSARYVSATAEALIGGDLYEVVRRDRDVRLLIGDVRGKGLAAVRTATVVLGEFRAAAADVDHLDAVAAQMSRRLHPHLGPEDFVTAAILHVGEDGRYEIVSCGHPPPLLCSNGALVEAPVVHGVPLGFKGPSVVTRGHLAPGDRVLLYTDGITEARDARGAFPDLLDLARPVAGGAFEAALDDVLVALRAAVGTGLGDDLALLLAEYAPEER